jgi:hypothetical protein
MTALVLRNSKIDIFHVIKAASADEEVALPAGPGRIRDLTVF